MFVSYNKDCAHAQFKPFYHPFYPDVMTMTNGSPASKAYKVFLLFVAYNFVRYARIKAGEPRDEPIQFY